MQSLWDEIVDYLRATCNSLTSALETFEAQHLEDYMPFLEYLDSQIFLCDACGWWCEISEANDHEDYGQPICEQCLYDT